MGMFDDLIPQSEPTARITVNKGPDYGSAIASIESGGNYGALGPVTRTGDRAYGKYQVMGANIGPWTQEVFGQPLDAQTFLKNPQIQDAVFQAKFGNYVSKYGPEGAARAWFAGEGGMNDPNRRDQLGTSVAQYGQRFTQALGPQPAQQPAPQAAAQPMAELSFDDLIPASPVESRFGEFAPVPNAPQLERRLQATAPVYRGSVLPFTKNLQTGETFFDINSGLTGALKRAVMLPGQVASGEIQLPSRDGGIPGSVDYDSPEGREALGRVLETASVMTPLSAASRVGAASVAAAAKPAVPELSAVKQAAQAAYKAADDAGVVISQQRYGDLAGNIASSVRGAGFHPKIHPKVAGVLEEVANTVGSTPTLSELEIVRRIAQSAAKSMEKDERRVARIVVDKIDDFVKGMGQGDIVAGDAAVASKAITEARSLWATSAKAETIEGLIQRAKDQASQFSGSGYENALRTVFRNFVKNPKAMRGFTAEEQAALRRVANGGKVDNLFRYLGKLAPTGIVSGALGGGGGYAVGGPIGAVVAPAVGALSRVVATRRTQNNANAARDLVLSRANPPAEPVAAPSVDRARRLFELMLKPTLVGSQNMATARAR